MKIRECREQDLELLEVRISSGGQTRQHAIRFERQQRGLSTYLIAWVDSIPVGTGEILWQGCSAPEVIQRYSQCPELNGLAVWPVELQSQGTGTAVVRAAEALAHDRGYQQIGLGVADDNPRAAALYQRLGYQETGCRYLDRYHYLDDHGRRHDVADPARFLVKQLQERQPQPGNPPPAP
ncbi:GNAT family N-acetyltransferase [Parafrankia discariae]|uniref:GNAT family N-acetyltransferase n=1 Tax=Parafrankia discariae TaxID=365528 RepID=UPI000360AAB9|nr:GNAT family N-acetyltransferase [Parafrankia discariae]